MHIYFCIVSLLVCKFYSYKITITIQLKTLDDFVSAQLVLSLYAQHANTANLHLVERPCVVD